MNDMKRYALVISNFGYETLNTLETPENDCMAVGEKLKEPLNFQVTLAVNTTQKELYSHIAKFMEQVKDNLSDIIFYYSGHGCSVQGKNYIIPIDGIHSSEFWANRTYVSLDDIIDALVQFRRLDTVPIIIILNCYRPETLIQDQKHQSNLFVKDDGRHINIFIMYATGMNQVTSDGNGQYSIFTKLLLTHMSTNDNIETISKNMMTNLRDNPNDKNTQVFWTGSSLLKPYNFRTASKENKIHSLQSISPQENLFWPKYPENLRFVDRPEIFKKIDYAIKLNRDNYQLRPIVLCGLGGMGKSQIVLKFCYRNKDKYRYIFWIDADTETALQSSFLDAANMLNLPGIAYTKAENVVPQMITWLHNNDGWLLVFDNCDDYSLGFASESRRLQNKYFPKKGNGVILMTTRNSFAEGDGLAINFDEMKMDDNAALELLMRKKVDIADIDPNALEIVKQLGHLPLAIDLTGALMNMEKLTPADFLERYREDPMDYLDLADIQRQTGSSYGKTVLTVWKVSFDHIKIKNPLAADLLRYIAFLYPDNIPLALFNNHCAMIFKTSKPLSTRSLSVAANLLQSFSLIQRTIREDNIRNSCAKDTLTIHRLVQKVIILDIGLQEKLQCCERLISSLSHEVPSELLLNNKDSQATMEAYVPHVQHVVMQFSQSASEPYDISGELISLLSPTIVYLIRHGIFDGVEYLAKLCVSTSEKMNGELHPDTAAALSKLSSLYVSQSAFTSAEPHCLRCLRIRWKLFGSMCKDTISALHDMAYIYSNLGRERHATQLYWEAAVTDDQEAQMILAARYRQGIGAPVHENLSLYWMTRSLEKKSPDKPVHLNVDVRVDLTPLHYAIQQGDINKIRDRTMQYKQYATIGDRDGKISLHIAAENGDIKILQLLMNEFQLDKDIQDNQGQTALHLAANNGHIMVVKLLVKEFGADASIIDINKKTPAELAAKKGNFEIMSFIIHETAITSLNIKESKIGDEGVRALVEGLKQNTTLIDLNINGNKIGVEGAHTLAECLKQNITLTNVNFSWNNISDKGSSALAGSLKYNTALANLNLCRNNISTEGARALAECLKHNSVLTNLNLYQNKIGAEGAWALAESLKQNITLTDLNLFGNSIGTEGACALAESLKENTYLTNLNLYFNEIGAEGACALAKALKQNTTLTSLNFGGNRIGDEGVHALAESLKQNTVLANLNLQNNSISVESTCTLAECLKINTALTDLDISWNSIGDEGACALAEGLKQNKALVTLDIHENNIADKGARALAKGLMQNRVLINLNFGENGIDEESARALADGLKYNTGSTNLSLEIQLSVEKKEDITFGWKPSPPLKESQKRDNHGSMEFKFEENISMIKLDFEWNAVDIARAATLNQAKTAIRLLFNHEDVNVSGARILADFLKYNTTITNLVLISAKIGAEGARALAESLKQNTTVTKLNLERNNIGDEGVCALAETLKRNTPLTKLNLEGNSIDADGTRALAKSLRQNTILTNLNLEINRIGDEGACALGESLKQNTALSNLSLKCNNICVKGARALANGLRQNTTLINLKLYKNNIGDEGTCALAESLKQNMALTNLDLWGNNIGDKGASALAEGLKENTALTTLGLQENSISDEGACALAECLMRNTILNDLDLWNNNIGDEGARTLGECLKHNTALNSLRLERNSIGAEGARGLAEGLKQNTALTYLNLEVNNIGAEGTCGLAESLKHNATLTILYLLENNIGDEGACALAEALKQNTALTHLDLRKNSIGNKGADSFAECLKQNKALTNLCLWANNISDEGACALAKGLRQNITLIKLDLNQNRISTEGIHTLTESIGHIRLSLYLR